MYDYKKNWWLYVLKLENGKWYVGITSKTPEVRFAEHLASKSSAYWTMKHKPIEIELVEDLGIVSRQHAEKYEAKVTRNLMKERGLNNVRGGDLRDVGEYVQRFGWILDKERWDTVLYIVLLLLVILWLFLDKYQWSIRMFVGLIITCAVVIIVTEVFSRKRRSN